MTSKRYEVVVKLVIGIDDPARAREVYDRLAPMFALGIEGAEKAEVSLRARDDAAKGGNAP